MRTLGVLMLVVAVGGCGDDTTSGSNNDIGAGGAGGSDLSVTGDLLGCGGTFGGFPTGGTQEQHFDCPCGCVIDSMDEANVSGIWGSTVTTGSAWTPMINVGLGADLHYTNAVAQAGLYSAGSSTVQFYLDGDFDLLLDYDMVTRPPGQAHLVLGVREPGVVMNTQTYDVERQQASDGTGSYASMLGGVPNVTIPTTAMKGTLRITRQGYMYTTYGDGNTVTTLIAQQAGRVAVTATAVLADCALSDGGTSCQWQPRFHNMRLASGTIVNLPN